MADPSNIFKKVRTNIEERIFSGTSHPVSSVDALIQHPRGCTSQALQASPFGNGAMGFEENSISISGKSFHPLKLCLVEFRKVFRDAKVLYPLDMLLLARFISKNYRTIS